jgi:DNA-binding MarR family transcriptional regulator
MSTPIAAQAAAIDEAAAALVSLLDPAGCDEVAHVSPTQLRVLTLLGANSAMNVNGLAESLSVNASSASRLCDRLEALGLLERSAHPHDRREVKLQLTAEAYGLLETLTAHRRRALASVLAGMPEPSRRELVRSMSAFAEAYADEYAQTGRERVEGRSASTQRIA